MYPIYVSDDAKAIENGNLWLVTAPNGQFNIVWGTCHIDHPALRKSTPERDLLFRTSKKFFLKSIIF